VAVEEWATRVQYVACLARGKRPGPARASRGFQAPQTSFPIFHQRYSDYTGKSCQQLRPGHDENVPMSAGRDIANSEYVTELYTVTTDHEVLY
jgi:hypothetical protein